MAPPQIQPRRGGGSGGRRVYSSNKTSSKKTTPRQQQKRQQREAGPRSSPRLPLTKTRGQGGSRFAGYEKRQANAHKQRRTSAHGGFAETKSGPDARGGSSATPSRRRANMPEVTSPPINEESKKAQEEGAKVVQNLQRELVGAAQSVVDKAEADCEAMFASALEGCSVWTATREKDDELELTALREVESKETSVISRSSELLREIETNRKTLSQMTERFVAALDGVVHAESRRVKTSIVSDFFRRSYEKAKRCFLDAQRHIWCLPSCVPVPVGQSHEREKLRGLRWRTATHSVWESQSEVDGQSHRKNISPLVRKSRGPDLGRSRRSGTMSPVGRRE